MLGSVTAQDAALAGLYGDDKGDTAPTSFLGHLFTGDPTTSGVEVTGTGYSPPTIANTTANFGAASGGQIGPINIDFGTAGAGGWGTPDHWALTDTSGNLYDTQEISDPGLINDGDPVTLTITINAA